MADEKNFENRVKKFLHAEGCWFIKYWGGGSYTKAGVPDLLVCCRGRFIGVELKGKNGRPAELQLYSLRKLDEAGGIAILLYPDDINVFAALVHKLMLYEGLLPDSLPEYEHFRKVRKEWEQKLSVSVHLNSLNYGC